MRVSCSKKASLIWEDGKAIGVDSGFDFCAEHEWGVKGIQEAFGIPNKDKFNIGRWRITEIPDKMIFQDSEKEGIFLYFNGKALDRKELDKRFDLDKSLIESETYRSIDISCAWDEESFMFVGRTVETKRLLKDLYSAFLEKDVAIKYSRVEENPFSNPSIQIIIISRVPQKIREKISEFLMQKK